MWHCMLMFTSFSGLPRARTLTYIFSNLCLGVIFCVSSDLIRGPQSDDGPSSHIYWVRGYRRVYALYAFLFTEEMS